MADMDTRRKLIILADAAKYDASCASSGTSKRDSSDGRGLGSTEGAGICHSYAPDGRCISLLKVLLTNWCVYDCKYCVNRESSDVARARFTVDEVVNLTLDFYRRNVIEGLNAVVQKVVVSDLKDATFYAVIFLLVGTVDPVTIDARPSDAIALALRTKAPIFVEDSVIERAKSSDIATERAESDRLQKWLEGLDPDDLGKYKM